MTIENVVQEILIKRMDISVGSQFFDLDSIEFRVANTTIQWMDELLQKIYKAFPSTRPKLHL